jgi:uncharacterized repeat protein (TIGR03833 family)
MSDLPANDQIKIGSKVDIETKEDQGTGKLTEGVVKTKLTSSKTHPHGIKVELEDGNVGRVKKTLPESTVDDSQNIRSKIYDKLKNNSLDVVINNDHDFDSSLKHSNEIDTSIPKDEDTWNEFKSTFQYDLQEETFRNEGKIEAADARRNDKKRIRDDIQKEVSITVSAFANQEGGRLFVGVDDDSSSLGLERDLTYFNQSKDRFKLAIVDSLKKFLKNNAFIAKLKFDFTNAGNDECLIILVPKSTEPVYLHFSNIQEAYVRMQNRSQKFNTEEFLKHCKDRF